MLSTASSEVAPACRPLVTRPCHWISSVPLPSSGASRLLVQLSPPTSLRLSRTTGSRRRATTTSSPPPTELVRSLPRTRLLRREHPTRPSARRPTPLCLKPTALPRRSRRDGPEARPRNLSRPLPRTSLLVRILAPSPMHRLRALTCQPTPPISLVKSLPMPGPPNRRLHLRIQLLLAILLA